MGLYSSTKRTRIKGSRLFAKKNCGWRIHAAKTHDGEAFQVKTFKGKDHNCGWERDNRWVTSKWLADKYVANVRDTPDWSNTAFKNQVLRDHNVEVSRHQTYRAKRKAKKQVEGSHAEQFSKLWGYCAIIRKTNPCSTMKLKLENSCFQRMYCCLNASAVYKMRRTPEEYVDPYYSTSTFLNAYSTTIGPVPGEEYWPPTNCNQILPPEYKTTPGKPKKARKRAEDEPQNPFTNANTRKGVTTKNGLTVGVLERMLMPRGFIKFVLIPFTIKSLVRLLVMCFGKLIGFINEIGRTQLEV
ncbi:Glycoside hydrolase, family 47 [Senna tora]|uniref:Glycoside hydrolase, family 47 n=1 Tax=Senna tora TaxID=362788 RepID=A0A834WLB4_9FABA|nr:Glycoside hydrolase, family 47 [Senna tora]